MTRTKSASVSTLALAAMVLLATVALGQQTTKVLIPVGFRLDTKAAPAFSSLMLQQSIVSDRSLAQLVQETSVAAGKAAGFGFAAASDEAKTFLIGAIYSEALAYLNSNNPKKAAERFKTIEQELIAMHAPPGLFNVVVKTRYALQSAKYPQPALLDLASLFQPLFADYAQAKSADRLVLFRAGSWLSDFALVAAAGDNKLIHRESELEYVLREMIRLEAPKGVIDSLKEMQALLKKPELATRDMQKIGSLIRNIQSLLA